MNSLLHPDGDLEAIDLEIGRLALLCGLSLLQPGVVEAVLHGDQGICRHRNALAWAKLRGLLVLHYHVVVRSSETEGAALTAAFVQHSAARVRERLQRRGLDQAAC